MVNLYYLELKLEKAISKSKVNLVLWVCRNSLGSCLLLSFDWREVSNCSGNCYG